MSLDNLIYFTVHSVHYDTSVCAFVVLHCNKNSRYSFASHYKHFYARTGSHSGRRLPFDVATTRPEKGIKRPRCQTDHLTPPKAEVTNVTSHIPTSPFHTCLYGVYKDKTYFTLSLYATPPILLSPPPSV
jgi:hypothetical protein